MPPILFPVWLVTHRELQGAARIRLVFDMLAEALAQPGQRDVPATGDLVNPHTTP